LQFGQAMPLFTLGGCDLSLLFPPP